MQDNLIKLRSSKGGMYVFDALTNNIYNIENEDEFKSLTINDLGHDKSQRLDPLKTKNIDHKILSSAKTLVIELTEKCNLRCTYCVFDESSPLDRNHANNSISLEVALDSVTDFYKRTSGEVAYIVFYGGEPLLEIDKIKKIVSHANDISNKKIKFSFTTNGTNLTKEKFKFFIENDFLITISLDGGKETHDKFRVTKNGKGTFNIVISNLQELKKYNDEYSTNRVQINCVIPSVHEISSINEFFYESGFNLDSVRFSAAIQNQSSINSSIRNSIIENNNISPLSVIENSYISDIVKKIEFRELDERAGNGKKICIPFSNRTYVRTDSSIQFCERIGDFSKIDKNSNLVDSALNIISNFNGFKSKDCSSCFAYNFCEMCPASFILNGQFDSKIAFNKCNEYRELVKISLLIYINKEELKLE